MINSNNLSLDKKNIDTILVLDFGSQYTQLIARRIRELNVFSVILPWDVSTEKIKSLNPKESFSLEVLNQLPNPILQEFLKLFLN